jgi:hypothetical protein
LIEAARRAAKKQISRAFRNHQPKSLMLELIKNLCINPRRLRRDFQQNESDDLRRRRAIISLSLTTRFAEKVKDTLTSFIK